MIHQSEENVKIPSCSAENGLRPRSGDERTEAVSLPSTSGLGDFTQLFEYLNEYNGMCSVTVSQGNSVSTPVPCRSPLVSSIGRVVTEHEGYREARGGSSRVPGGRRVDLSV